RSPADNSWCPEWHLHPQFEGSAPDPKTSFESRMILASGSSSRLHFVSERDCSHALGQETLLSGRADLRFAQKKDQLVQRLDPHRLRHGRVLRLITKRMRGE